MPRDENGVFTPLRDWETDAANGTPFSPDRWNAQDADFAEALNDLPLKTVVPTVVPAGTLPTEVNPGSIMYEDGVVYIRIGEPVWVDVSSVGLTDADAIVADVVEAVLDEGSALFHDTVLTGTPTAPTAVGGTNTTQIATTEFVRSEIDGIVNAAPGALDTLSELATALGNDADFATTMTNALAGKSPVGHSHAIADVTGLSSRVVPAGGAAGQVLAKTSATDYATEWADPGAKTFVGLTDTPAAYTGHANKLVAVNSAADALEFAVRRRVLTADLTLYVRTDGNDSNTGLVNSAGGAFATIQKAVDVAAALDLSIYTVTIAVGWGTYTAGAVLKSVLGAVSIVGDETTPANVVIQPASGACFTAVSVQGRYFIGGFKTVTTGGAIQYSVHGSFIELGHNEYGDAAGSGIHIFCGLGGRILAGNTNYTISGSSFGWHIFLDNNSFLYSGNRTITFTGNPTFTEFVRVTGGANLRLQATFSGSVSAGKQFDVRMNGTADTAGSTYPGPTSGTTQTGGQFA